MIKYGDTIYISGSNDNPIVLIDKLNTGLTFDNLTVGKYTIEIYDDTDLINSEIDIVISEPDPIPEATIENMVPSDATVNGGSDGAIAFDVTIANFVFDPLLATVINQKEQTRTIALNDGENIEKNFSNLPAETYRIYIYMMVLILLIQKKIF